MKAVYRRLLDNAVAAALSAIEVYNKPDFKYREEVFVVLIVNAWELLLKAKIIKDNKNRVNSIYVYDKRRIKRNRSGGPMTIEITRAIDKISLPPGAESNLKTLITIRDSTIHFYHSGTIAYIVYALGAASLTNFDKYVREWFDHSLSEYNFYIMPMGFAYEFKTFRILSLEKQPDVVAGILKSIIECQEQLENDKDDSYSFVCEVRTELTSAKKFTEAADLTAKIDGDPSSAAIITRVQRPTDKYPLSYREVLLKVKKARPSLKQPQIDRVIREHGIKRNLQYADYIFRCKAHEDAYKKTGDVPATTPSVYNEEAVRFILKHVDD